MPLFDPNAAASAEAAALYSLAELLADCANAQALAEASGPNAADETRKKIIVGPDAGPNDGTSFTRVELENQLIEFHITVPIEGGRTCVKSDGSFDRADEQGEFLMFIRRHAREAEMADPSDLYLFFLDRVSALEQELLTKAETRECPRLLAVTRTQGPAYGAMEETTAQGDYIFTQHTITWGDLVGDAGAPG